MSFLNTLLGDATHKALDALGTKANPSSSAPWMQYANMLKNNVQNTTLNAGKQNRPAQPTPAPAPAQQGNPAPQGQLPGKNGYTPTTSPYGQDMSNPGVQEQFWDQNQKLWTNGAFQGPGQGEQFWNQVQGNYNKASADLTPQFNAYYDQAAHNAASSANNQAASRGVYGSSQALNGVNGAVANVESQRAKASTDFMFQNANNQNQALNSYGNMAFGSQSMTNNRNAMDQSMLNNAYGAAGAAQSGRNNRIQGQFNNERAMAGMYLPFMQGNYDSLIGTDAALVGGANDSKVGAATAALGQQQQNRQQNSQDLSNGLSLYGAFGGGRGGGGSSPAPSQPSPSPYSSGSYIPGYNNY